MIKRQGVHTPSSIPFPSPSPSSCNLLANAVILSRGDGVRGTTPSLSLSFPLLLGTAFGDASSSMSLFPPLPLGRVFGDTSSVSVSVSVSLSRTFAFTTDDADVPVTGGGMAGPNTAVACAALYRGYLCEEDEASAEATGLGGEMWRPSPGAQDSSVEMRAWSLDQVIVSEVFL